MTCAMKAPAVPTPEWIVPAGGRAHLAAGGLDVAAPGLAVSGAVRLVDDDGDLLGEGLADPDNAYVRLWSHASEGLPLGGALAAVRVERAMARRRTLGLVAPDATYRLLHGAGDGTPGIACDVLGGWAVVWAYGAALLPIARQIAEAVRGFVGVAGVVVKLRRKGGETDVTQEVVGATPPDAVVAHEDGVPFELHLQGGLNTGLFTDMREHRHALARLAPGRRVLNLFAYTGALSVACARAGAASVTSVDTADGVLAWARGNFSRSGLDDAARWRFAVGDAGRYLARAAKERERYDLVLIDPPTHSPAKGGAGWVIGRDYPALIVAAAAVIPDGGLLWLAANSPDLGSLPALAGKALARAGRAASVLSVGGLPPDFPTLPAQPKDRYLQVCLLGL